MLIIMKASVRVETELHLCLSLATMLNAAIFHVSGVDLNRMLSTLFMII